MTGCDAPAIAHSGSFSPWPVSTHTTVAPRCSVPAAWSLSSPATLAALAGSANNPSRATRRYDARISRSVTARICPSDSVAADSAFRHDAGLPMRMAVAIVCGSLTTSPRTIGAAPCAWNPNSCGGSTMTPSWRYSE